MPNSLCHAISGNTRSLRHAALALGLLAPAGDALAADTATVTGEVEVITVSTLSNTQSLNFGTVATSGTGGAIQINANTNVRTTVGELVPMGTTAHRAEFAVLGPVGRIMVMVGDPDVTLTRSGGTETMTANLIYRTGSGFTPAAPFGSLVTAATQQINVGGTLFVPGTQMSGYYEGTFQLTVIFL